MSGQVILVVEDDVMIRMLMVDILSDEGYAVVEAASGDEGLDILSSGRHLDLVITDVRMPGKIDGVTLTGEAKRAYPTLPVIVVSGHLHPEAASRADAFLCKPYAPSTFLEIVTRLIGQPGAKRPPHGLH
ncbi:MAG: response regulator [Novosphingobium sp.]